jgi:hypothetical protein
VGGLQTFELEDGWLAGMKGLHEGSGEGTYRPQNHGIMRGIVACHHKVTYVLQGHFQGPRSLAVVILGNVFSPLISPVPMQGQGTERSIIKVQRAAILASRTLIDGRKYRVASLYWRGRAANRELDHGAHLHTSMSTAHKEEVPATELHAVSR